MKKTGWAIAIAAFAYTYLFYEQNTGINFLVYGVLLTLLQVFINKEVLKNKSWLLFATASIYSGFMILIVNSDLSVVAFCVSLCIQSIVTINAGYSIPVNILNAACSGAGSLIFMILDIKENSFQKGTETERNAQPKLLIYSFVFILIFIFFIIYRNINPLFEDYTRRINLDFLTVTWFLFLFTGILIAYSFMKPKALKVVNSWEIKQNMCLQKNENSFYNLNEKKGILYLFVILNLMLIAINALDLNYLYFSKSLPAGVTHKQFVHNGVGMLLFSILLGISVILVAFRGHLNFDPVNRTVKFLVYAWLVQNMFMVVSTCLRNHMYIHEALLTYKRIGVYYWLVLAFFGLLVTFIKVSHHRKAWFLVTKTSVFAYTILVVSACIDWDRLIADYNFSHIRFIASLDKKYLLSLSETNLDKLYSIKNDPKFDMDSVYHYEYYYHSSNRNALDAKLYKFLADQQKKDWRSFNFRSERVKADIKKINMTSEMDTLNLSEAYVKTLRPVFELTQVKHLVTPIGFDIDSSSVTELYHFPKLRSLNLYVPNVQDSASLRLLPASLKTVYLRFYGTRQDSVVLMHKKFSFQLVVL